MSKWRVQYKAPNGELQQTMLEVDGAESANDVRTMIVDGQNSLYVATEALILVERIEEN